MNHFVTGVVSELLTPFDAHGVIDHKMLGDLTTWQCSQGINNFFINGYGGECHELSLEEKLSCLETVSAHVSDEAKIMACSFENSLEQNQLLLHAYMEQDLADCFCITAPPFFSHSQAALYDWASLLIDYCDRPVYIYNCVQQSVLFAPDTLMELVNAHSNLRGFKDASVDILNFEQCVLRIDPETFDFLGGCDGLDGVMMLLGAVGCVSFMAVPWPREMIDIVECGLKRDYDGCLRAQKKVLRIRNLCKQTPFNAGWIYGMRYGGGPTGMHSRMVKKQDLVSAEIKKSLDELMREFGYVVD